MELRRRDFLAVSGVSVGALLLAACSSNSTGATGAATTAAAGGQLGILTPEFEGTTGKAALEEGVLANFGDDWTFKVDYTAWDRLNEKLSAAVAGGVVSDLIMTGAGWVEPFAQKGVLAELPEQLVAGKNLNDNLLKVCRYDGTLYALPYFFDGRLLPYHKPMFEAAGITEAHLPTNLEDFREMLKVVKPAGGIGIDLFSTNIRQTWCHFLGAFGGSLFNADGTKVTFTDGTGVDALQYMVDLVADGTASFEIQAAEGQPRPWQQQQAALDVLNSSSWPDFQQQSPDLVTEDQMGMMLLPSAGGGDPVMFQGGTLLTMSARTEHQEAVQELMELLLEPANLITAVQESGKVPARSDIDDPVVTENRMAQFVIDNFQYATATEGGSPAWMEIRGKVAPEIEAAVIGQKTPKQAIDALAAAAEDAISRI